MSDGLAEAALHVVKISTHTHTERERDIVSFNP